MNGAVALTVGELARRAGLTVRALRHYDEIGLLSFQRRTWAGYRLYGEAEIQRLQQIASPRRLMEYVGKAWAVGKKE